MRRPTKDGVEFLTILMLILGLFAWNVVSDGILKATIDLVLLVIAVTVVLGLLSLVRKLGR